MVVLWLQKACGDVLQQCAGASPEPWCSALPQPGQRALKLMHSVGVMAVLLHCYTGPARGRLVWVPLA